MTLGHAGRLFVVRVPDHVEGGLDAAATAVVLDGVRQVAAGGSAAGPGELAVLLDPEALSGAADRLGEQLELVVPLSSDDADFQLAADHGFGSQLEAAGATVAHVEVRWGSGHDPGAKKSQAVELTRLAAWLHETGRALLVELTVPGLDLLAAAERTEELLKTVREVREVGIEADLWALPGPLDADAVDALRELVRDAGRDDVAILVADGGPEGDDGVVARGTAGVAGFVLGPSIWSDALRRRRNGEVDDASAASQVADRLRQAIAAAGSAGT